MVVNPATVKLTLKTTSDLECWPHLWQGCMTPPNIELIRQRAELLRNLRHFFDSRAFLEVQTPCLSHDCVVDAYIDPIEVSSSQFGLGNDLPQRYFLQTSPEAAMKRMLAEGAPSIYSLGPVFRSREQGDFHNLEFTMLEWYQVCLLYTSPSPRD